MTILCKIAICSGFNAGGLPPVLLDGSVPSSGCVVATACSSHIEIACHNFVVDFVSPLSSSQSQRVLKPKRCWHSPRLWMSIWFRDGLSTASLRGHIFGRNQAARMLMEMACLCEERYSRFLHFLWGVSILPPVRPLVADSVLLPRQSAQQLLRQSTGPSRFPDRNRAARSAP